MEGESSNSFRASRKKHEDKEDKPIMKLFKDLIASDRKVNTVLTNGQIIELLQKDFQIDTGKLHELELDIYVNIVKKFLKDWPLWDEIDAKQRHLKDKAKLHKYLLVKYDQLKQYISVMLDIARPQAKDKVKELELIYNEATDEDTEDQDKSNKETETKSPPADKKAEVILEIQCSRDQLNGLFYNKPHPDKNNTVFNTSISVPNREIHVNNLSYNAVLNWWNVAITLKFSSFFIIRSTVHESAFTLVNKKLALKQKVKELNQYFQEKRVNYSQNLGKTISKQSLVTLPQIVKNVEDGMRETGHTDTYSPIFETFAKDLIEFPAENGYKYMVWYRKYFSKYPYKRYLCSDVETKKETSKKYDLKLKEMISPMYQLQVMELSCLNQTRILKEIKLLGHQGIILECQSCSIKFSELNALEQLKQHILDHHFNEPDWQCVKCKETFTMVYLAEHRWCHVCK